MLCENQIQNYRGLDSSRDTEEVEATVRLFPDLLSESGDPYGPDEYHVQYLAHIYDNGQQRRNLNDVSSIPLLIRLAIEFRCFDEELIGGLLIPDDYGENVIQ
jgi:hypothetical protein